MKLKNWLDRSVKKLKDAGIGTARLDCLVLLTDALKKDKAYLLAHPDVELNPEIVKELNTHIVRRSSHEPLAYIRARTEFYRHDFYINKNVLEPRPESETMIDLLKSLCKVRPCKVTVDIGTGSGALGITAKLEIPELEVILTDIDPACLEVARQNAKKHKVNVKILQGNLLVPIYILNPASYILLCNLPYVPDSYEINRAALSEPKNAIFGGSDGLDLYRALFQKISNRQIKPRYVLTESLPFQHQELRSLASNAGYNQIKESDFIQVFENTV